VRGWADVLHRAADVARQGASTLYYSQRSVLNAIQDAQAAGFYVAEDLSVADRYTGGSPAQQAARQVQAQQYAADIQCRAVQLAADDKRIAAKITTTTAALHAVTFSEAPKPQIQAVDQHTFKQDPPPAPGPPGNPFAGWTDEQMAQVATEIANGHALKHFPGKAPADLARSIYDAMKDPNTRIGSSLKSGGLTLLKSDGTIIFINPQDGDYGTAFEPKPTATTPWQTPLEYFEQNTRAVEPLSPPVPGRFPPLTPGEMAPPEPGSPVPAAPRPAPAPPVEAPAPKPGLPPEVGGGPMIGGPATPFGPHVIHPPHSIPHHLPILGEDDPWENPRDFE
jgi:hypothetical protein